MESCHPPTVENPISWLGSATETYVLLIGSEVAMRRKRFAGALESFKHTDSPVDETTVAVRYISLDETSSVHPLSLVEGRVPPESS